MPRKSTNGRYTPERAQQLMDWYKTADAGLEGIGDWDIKTELLAEFVLTALSLGYGVMFGTVGGGALAGVTIYEGDAKRRKWVRDSVEFEDAMLTALAQWRARAEVIVGEKKGGEE